MSELTETPAVPEEPSGGDERLGLLAAGGILVAMGWGIAVFLNLLLHVAAPSNGLSLGLFVVHPGWGLYAWTAALIGLLTGAVGAGILYVARSVPSGPLVLPGYDY